MIVLPANPVGPTSSAVVASMFNFPVTVVGAGLAGLTLGRCLRRNNIPAIVLDKAKVPPQSNYAITLHPWAYRPLLRILELDEATFRNRVSVDYSSADAGMLLCDEHLLVIEKNGSFRCHRGRLEQLLGEGQDIRWDHRLENVELTANNATVKVANKEAIITDIVVGADGVHSKARQLLMPTVRPRVLPFVVFNGKRVIDIDVYRIHIQPNMHGNTIIQTRQDDVLLEISLSDYGEENAHLSYTYSRPARQDDSLHRPNRSTEEASLIPEAFYSELDQLENLSGAFAQIFQSSRVRQDRVLHWLMRSSWGPCYEIEDLARHGVLMIGDAVHAMPILGGDGGNVAIEDAIELAEYLAKHGRNHLDKFMKLRFECWRKAIGDSETRLLGLHLSNLPGGPLKPGSELRSRSCRRQKMYDPTKFHFCQRPKDS